MNEDFFDDGFLAGHVLIHTLDDPTQSAEAVGNLLKGYSEASEINFDTALMKRITLGSALYRLSNPVIPYKLSLSKEERMQKADMAFLLLEEKSISWYDLVTRMAMA